MTIRSHAMLRVYANPYAALDPNGMPCGVTRHDPEHGRKGAVEMIGVEITRTPILKRGEDGKPIPADPQRDYVKPVVKHDFAYDLTPQQVPHTDFVLRRLRKSEIIAADQETATLAKLEGWTSAADALAQAKDAVIADWKSKYGEEPPVGDWPVFELLREPKPEPPAEPAEDEAAPAAPAAPVTAPAPKAAAAPPKPTTPAAPPAPAPSPATGK